MADWVTTQTLSDTSATRCTGRKEETRASARAWWASTAVPALKDTSGWSGRRYGVYSKMVRTDIHTTDEEGDEPIVAWFQDEVRGCVADAAAPYHAEAFFVPDDRRDAVRARVLVGHFTTL